MRIQFIRAVILLSLVCTVTTVCFGQVVPESSSTPTGVNDNPVHHPENAPSQFEVHPRLEVGLFAAEPLLANPTNIDVDHLGRVWVCEVVNYRHFRNTDAVPREAGDRILILEDTDGDAVADKSSVFYQGRDIDSAHGICVLGNRVLVSANDSVFYLIDTDGDSKADQKEILFTGIRGVQHDHGIHAFVFGPDGKLYFNFGNEGKQICDANGDLIVDVSGNPVTNARKPYNQGMVFRCNLDGSQFETLAWNFRNNWELCIDSFGSIWQSDNDDDGNRATRINFVMPFGDYGYTEQATGRSWTAPRTGMHREIPIRHWHQNDPGVIPNLMVTGAGSPTGICVYEGSLLPKEFQNQIIHCDAGPSVVRSYPVKKSGAGYTASIVNMMDAAANNQWFRPSDVCVAPDGSVIVADWYDPGVGGHRMQDTNRGRLFRVTPRGAAGSYGTTPAYFTTPESAAKALRSPNQATRYLAWTALNGFGVTAKESVEKLWRDGNPRIRARGLWMLIRLGLPKNAVLEYLDSALSDSDPDIRVTAVRACVQLRDEISINDVEALLPMSDGEPAVRREILLGIRQWLMSDNHRASVWSRLADQYESGDRWYLEALGIAADGHWDDCLKVWLGEDEASRVNSAAGRDIIWRSRGGRTPDLIANIIALDSTRVSDLPRLFRAFDFLEAPDKKRVLLELAFREDLIVNENEKSKYVVLESIRRLDSGDFSEQRHRQLGQIIEQSRGTGSFIEFVGKFSSRVHYRELLEIASSHENRQRAADAMGVLMEKKQMGMVYGAIVNSGESNREIICDSLVNCGQRQAAFLLTSVAKSKDLDSELRMYAINRLGEIRSGAGDMVRWFNRKQEIDPVLLPAIAAALHRSRWPNVKKRAQELFPIAPSKGDRPLPTIDDLVKMKGDAANGKRVFEGVGTCAKCHLVNGKGIEVGPDQSEIGSKLTRQAMFESILFPSAGISHNYEQWMVQTIDGNMIVGVLLGETDVEIQLRDDKGIRHIIPTDEIEAKKKLSLSMMPADLHAELSEQELLDLVEYLMTLKKR